MCSKELVDACKVDRRVKTAREGTRRNKGVWWRGRLLAIINLERLRDDDALARFAAAARRKSDDRQGLSTNERALSTDMSLT